MKRWLGVGALVAIAAIVVGMRVRGRTDDDPPRDDARASPAASGPRGAPPPPAVGSHAAPLIRAPIHITRLDPDERAALVKRIGDARAARAARGTPTPGAAPVPDHVDELDLEHAPADLVDALQASIPILAECYRGDAGAPAQTPIVLMTLQGDPEIGTLVDPGRITDADGKPLDGAVSECLRSTLSSLELPPLQQGQELSIQYTFRFGSD